MIVIFRRQAVWRQQEPKNVREFSAQTLMISAGRSVGFKYITWSVIMRDVTACESDVTCSAWKWRNSAWKWRHHALVSLTLVAYHRTSYGLYFRENRLGREALILRLEHTSDATGFSRILICLLYSNYKLYLTILYTIFVYLLHYYLEILIAIV